MFKKNLRSDKYENDTSGDFSLTLVFQTEDVADLESDCRDDKCCDADERNGGNNVDVGQQGKGDADRKSVDARCDCKDYHRLERERVVRFFFIL